MSDVDPIKDDAAGSRVVQANNCFAERGLATATLADDSQRFALADFKADIVNRVDFGDDLI